MHSRLRAWALVQSWLLTAAAVAACGGAQVAAGGAGKGGAIGAAASGGRKSGAAGSGASLLAGRNAASQASQAGRIATVAIAGKGGAAGRVSTTATSVDPSTCVPTKTAHLIPTESKCAAGSGAPVLGPAQPPGFAYEGAAVDGSKVAYLTFDDGPSEWTPDFLDILREQKVKATFFVCARHLKKAIGLDGTFQDVAGKTVVFRDVLKRTVDEGHVIGNHTADHLDLASLPLQGQQAAFDENERLINQALVSAGAAPRPLTFVRPPFGSPWHMGKVMPDDVMAARAMVGATVQERGINVLWSIDSSDSADWALDESFTRDASLDPGRDPNPPTLADKVARLKDTVLSDELLAAGKSVVILMHDTHNATRDALTAIIEGLRAKGYSFGTLEDLAQTRWQRNSVEVTPGPRLYDACVEERERGCLARSAGDASDVCGRFWRIYDDAGGRAVLGPAIAAPAVVQATGALAQSFAHGVLEFHPDQPPPCDAVVRPALP